MDRRAFITVLAGSILAKPLAGEAQSTRKVYRIGYLTVPSRESAEGVANTFKHALGDLGWIDGQNVLIDYRFADSSGRVEDGNLLLSRVQITSNKCHESGLLFGGRVTVPRS